MMPASSSGLACGPPFSPLTSTCVVAVASGKGYLPCMSFTKYLRNGMRNSMPSIPPRSDAKNTLRNDALMASPYLACRMYIAGSVNIAPATTAPEQAPMLCMMTFSPKPFLRLAAVLTPTAMMAMGIAASNTCPTFSPR